MKKTFFAIILFLFSANFLFAQVGINNGATQPDPSAMLDVKAFDKGVLLPRITYQQRNAIVSPAEGLMVFCTDCGIKGRLSYFSNGERRTYAPCSSLAPTAGSHVALPSQITWNWSASSGATGYKWNTLNNYSTATDMSGVTTKTETALACNTLFTRYVWAYNVCGNSSSSLLTQTTLLNPEPPAAAHMFRV